YWRNGYNVSGLQFTGKLRDTEDGLDYFGARYYSSTLGRWMTPDWSAGAVAVPYAAIEDPQSLNLFGYLENNPTSYQDADGHCDMGDWCGVTAGALNAYASDNLLGGGRA